MPTRDRSVSLDRGAGPSADPARFRLTLVGCGRISERHFDAIDENSALELVAVCDDVSDRAKVVDYLSKTAKP